MLVDSTIRERLIRRLQDVFDSNAQNSGSGLSPHLASRVMNLPSGDSIVMPINMQATTNSPPWSPFETRHGIPENIGRNELVGSDPIITDGNTQLMDADLESQLYFHDLLDLDMI